MAFDFRAVGAAPAVAAVAFVAAVAAVLEPDAYASYDYAFAMASAQDLLAGRSSGYDVLYSPVPHPLTLLEALAIVPLGDVAFSAFTALALLGLGLLTRDRASWLPGSDSARHASGVLSRHE